MTHLDPVTTRRGEPDPRLAAALPTGRETVPIHRARKHLAAGLPDGDTCPVCGQHAELYRRPLHATMARDLHRAVATHGVGVPFHAPTLLRSHGGDFTKLAHWGLIDPVKRPRKDGGSAGWWKVTRLGGAFVDGTVQVRSHVLIYDGRAIGHDGEQVAFRSIVEGFDLRDIKAPADLPDDISDPHATDAAGEHAPTGAPLGSDGGEG